MTCDANPYAPRCGHPEPPSGCRNLFPYSLRLRPAAWGVLFLAVCLVACLLPVTKAAARQPTPLAATCAHYAAQAYGISETALGLVLAVEGGRAGQAVKNTNGSYDLGPMQINTLWLPTLKQKFGLTRAMIRDNACLNVFVGGWILTKHIRDTGSTVLGIARYHSRTPEVQSAYLQRVGNVLQRRLAGDASNAN